MMTVIQKNSKITALAVFAGNVAEVGARLMYDPPGKDMQRAALQKLRNYRVNACLGSYLYHRCRGRYPEYFLETMFDALNIMKRDELKKDIFRRIKQDDATIFQEIAQGKFYERKKKLRNQLGSNKKYALISASISEDDVARLIYTWTPPERQWGYRTCCWCLCGPVGLTYLFTQALGSFMTGSYSIHGFDLPLFVLFWAIVQLSLCIFLCCFPWGMARERPSCRWFFKILFKQEEWGTFKLDKKDIKDLKKYISDPWPSFIEEKETLTNTDIHSGWLEMKQMPARLEQKQLLQDLKSELKLRQN